MRRLAPLLIAGAALAHDVPHPRTEALRLSAAGISLRVDYEVGAGEQARCEETQDFEQGFPSGWSRAAILSRPTLGQADFSPRGACIADKQRGTLDFRDHEVQICVSRT